MPDHERPVILVAIKGLGIGGAEKLIVEGSRYWDRERFDYRVAYALPWKDQLVAPLRAEGIQVTCFGTRRGTSPQAMYRFAQLVRSSRAAIVHAHLPTMGALARVVTRVPIVYTEHNVASSYRASVRAVNRATYHRNARVIAVSDAVADSIAGYPSRHTMVVPNGVAVEPPDDAATVRSDLGIRPEDKLVVHVGNIRPLKGHKNLVHAAEHIARARSDVRIVSIGGEKSEGDLDAMRQYAREHDVADVVTFLGRRVDATRFIAAADVYVNPSDIEGLPISVLEALGLGRPVVATAVGGVPSIIIEEETGLLVEPRQPKALARGVLDLLEDPDRANALGTGGRRLVEKKYSLAAMVRSVEEIYDEVLHD